MCKNSFIAVSNIKYQDLKFIMLHTEVIFSEQIGDYFIADHDAVAC